ncbi:MAG: aspartyl protease family protein [Prevotella sp.]|nr:aspartyl protease family protein [Prevotella sp.]
MRLLFFLLIFLSAFSLESHARSALDGSPIDREKTKGILPPDTIPARFIGHRILIPARIGGKTATFLFDTGCSYTMLFDFRHFDVLPQRWEEVVDALGQVSQTLICQLPEMQVGRHVTHKSIAIAAPFDLRMDLFTRVAGIEGCIGMDLLADGRAVKIDMRNQRIIIADDPRVFSNEPGQAIPFTPHRNCPYVSITPFRGRSMQAVFDTGARETLTIPDDAILRGLSRRSTAKEIRRQTIDHTSGSRSSGIFGQAEPADMFLFRLSSFRIGKLAFDSLYATNAPGVARLGSGLLDYAATILDYSSHTMKLQPYQLTSSMTVSTRQPASRLPQEYSAHLTPDSLYTVSNVWTQSAAYAAGLRNGYTLKAIDGSTDDIISRYFLIHLREEDGHRLTFASPGSPDVTVE